MNDDPYYRQALEELFVDDTAWITVANNRGCPSGLMVFAYPERKYGYLAFKDIELDDIPHLIALVESKGFVFRGATDAATSDDPYAPESWKTSGHLSFSYSLPNAKWWTEFPENFVQVNA